MPVPTVSAAVDDAGMFRYGCTLRKKSDRTVNNLLIALESRVPLIVLAPTYGDTYQAIFPVYVNRCLWREQAVELNFGDIYLPVQRGPVPEYERRWSIGTTRHRLHQPLFRQDVLQAYKNRCAVCGLGVEGLVEAAHITPDRDDAGIASVINGMALCKNHHAAYDANILGVTEDLHVHILPMIKSDDSGSAAEVLLSRYDGQKLMVLPDVKERFHDPGRLAKRWKAFRPR